MDDVCEALLWSLVMGFPLFRVAEASARGGALWRVGVLLIKST